MEFFVFCVIVGIFIGGCIWGAITNAIIGAKGYDENWFWWGFFFGFWAVLVALLKPSCPRPMYTGETTHLTYAADRDARPSDYAKVGNVNMSVPSNGWKCNKCGRGNASYVGTCGCGNTKVANNKPPVVYKPSSTASTDSTSSASSSVNISKGSSANGASNPVAPISIADEITKFKKLLDDGVITQEEFDKKKKQLLDM